MGPRREGGGGFNPDRLAERLEARDDALRSRIETLFDGMGERLDRIERDGAKGERDRSAMASELAELRTLIGEGREATGLLARQLSEHIGEAKGAAEGASDAARTAERTATTVLQRITSGATWQKGTAWALAAMVVGFLIDKGPALVRFLNAWGASVAAFWAGLSE